MTDQLNLKSGERRNVTVLFSDMKDFSRLTERLDPEEMDGVMNTIYGAFESVVQEHGGTVEKYIGDALVAVFGVPTLHEDDPSRAITAAQDFLREVAVINNSLSSKGLSLSFRTGINTGLITTGRRGEFEVVTGHTMSVAARLESEAPVNGILVSESTKSQAESDFVFAPGKEYRVKGLEQPITAHVVTGRHTMPFHDDGPFVGRDGILDDMIRLYLRHDAKSLSGVILIGEAGIGKTATVGRFVSKLRQFPDCSAPVLYARGRRYGGTDFSVVVDMIGNYLEIDRSLAAETIRRRLVGSISIEEKTANEFAELVLDRGGKIAESRAFVVLYIVLKHIVGSEDPGPYAPVVFLDNASDMDRQSRDFFRFFIKNSEYKPFFVLTDRRIIQVIEELFGGLKQIEIPPLTQDQSIDLLAELWPELGNDEPAGEILAGGAGNPLYIREYVRFARNAQDTSGLPTTIQNIVLARVDGYEADLRALLKKLAVFRHSFSLEDAKNMQERTDGDPRVVEPAISFFLREGLLVHERDVYLFRHDLVKRALYDSLLNYNKRILHRIVAQLMMAQERPNTLRLLHHLVRAEEYQQAFEVLRNAPDSNINMEYVRYLDRIQNGIRGQADLKDTLVRLLFNKSAILFNNGHSAETDAILKDVLKIAVSEKNISFTAVAYHLLTAYNMKAYAFDKAYLCGTKALAYFRRSGASPANVQNLLHILAISETLHNNREKAEELIKSLTNVEDGDPNYTARAIAEVRLIQGNYGEAVSGIEAATSTGSASDRLGSYVLACLCYWYVCDFEKLHKSFLAIVEQPGANHAQLGQIYASAAVACRYVGEESRVGEYLQQAEYHSLQLKNDFDYIDTLRSLTTANLILGRNKEAETGALEGLSIGLRHSAYYPTFSILTSLTELYVGESRHADAAFFVNEASFYVQADVSLPRRELVLYHYFRHLLCEDSEYCVPSDEDDPARAKTLLTEEIAALGNPRLAKNLLSLRSFGKVAAATGVDAPGLASAD